MARIGNILISFEVETSPLLNGLKKADSKIGAWVDKVKKEMKQYENIFKTVGIGVGAALAVGGGLSYFVVETLKSIDASGDLAAQLSTSTDKLNALSYACQFTGSETEALSGSLLKLTNNLGESVVNAAAPAGKALKALGLDANELSRMDITDAFMKIAGGIKAIDNPAVQASAAMDIFGKQGIMLINSLRAGDEELGKLGAEFMKFGALGNGASDVAGAAVDQLDKLGLMATAVGQKVALKFAPMIIAAGEYLIELASSGEGVGSTLDKVFSNLDTFLSISTGTLQVFITGIKAVQVVMTGLGAAVLKTLAGYAKGIQTVANLIPGVKTDIGDQLGAMSDSFTDTLKDQLSGLGKNDVAVSGGTITKFFDDVKNKAAGAAGSIASAGSESAKAAKSTFGLASEVATLSESLADEIRTFEGSTSAKKIDALAQKGATDAMLEGVRAQSKQLLALEKVKKANEDLKSYAEKLKDTMKHPLESMQEDFGKAKMAFDKGLIDSKTLARSQLGIENLGDRVKSLYENTRTPMEKFRKEFEELQTLKDNGLIGEDLFNRGVQQAGQQNLSAFAGKHTAGALEAGAADTRSLLLNYNGPKVKDQVEYAKQSVDKLSQLVTLNAKILAKDGKPAAALAFGRGDQ